MITKATIIFMALALADGAQAAQTLEPAQPIMIMKVRSREELQQELTTLPIWQLLSRRRPALAQAIFERIYAANRHGATEDDILRYLYLCLGAGLKTIMSNAGDELLGRVLTLQMNALPCSGVPDNSQVGVADPVDSIVMEALNLPDVIQPPIDMVQARQVVTKIMVTLTRDERDAFVHPEAHPDGTPCAAHLAMDRGILALTGQDRHLALRWLYSPETDAGGTATSR